MKHIKLFEEFVNGDAIAVNEFETRDFKPASPNSKLLKGAEKWLKKYMLRTAKTTDEAIERISNFEGGIMYTHSQYFIAKPNGNKPDRPVFQLMQSQNWLNDHNLQGRKEVNATLLSIYQLKEGEDPFNSRYNSWDQVGQIYVDTKEFLDEVGISFEILKRVQ